MIFNLNAIFILSIAFFDFDGEILELHHPVEISKRIVRVCNALCKWLIILRIAKEESDEILNSRQEDTVTKNHNYEEAQHFSAWSMEQLVFVRNIKLDFGPSRMNNFDEENYAKSFFLQNMKAGISIESKFQQEKRNMPIWSMLMDDDIWILQQ